MNEKTSPKAAETARPVDAPFFWRILKKYALWIILLAVLGGGLAGLARSVLSEPVYTAEVSFWMYTVSTVPDKESGESLIIRNPGDIDGAVRTAQSAARLLTEPSVLETIRAEYEKTAQKSEIHSHSALRRILTVSPDEQKIRVSVSTEKRETTLAVAVALEKAVPAVVEQYFGVDPHAPEPQIGACAVSLTNLTAEGETAMVSQSPRSIPVYACLGFFAAGALACLVALILGYYDPRVGDAEELKRVAALPLLGSIPAPSVGLNPTASATTVMAYEELRTALARREAGKKVFAVTSDTPGVPSSAVAQSLALSFAKLDRRVLLIHGDLRSDSASRENVPNVQGGDLGQLLRRGADDKRALCLPSGIHENLSVIRSGGIHPSPAELLASESMGGLLDFARAQYDLVILDMPSLGECGDAVILSDQVDGYILTSREGVSKTAALRLAREKLELCGARAAGMVWISKNSVRKH